MKRSHLGPALGLVLGGCTSPTSTPVEVTLDSSPASTHSAPRPPPRASVAPAPAPSGAVDPSQWACEKPSDCLQTCALGAVAAGWLKAHPNADTCDDGCGWNTNKVTCREAQCVTVNADGTVDSRCSLRPYTPPKP
ncbi:MAG: hypothetical protein U0414_39425 [Polyangiaceae bacterium]